MQNMVILLPILGMVPTIVKVRLSTITSVGAYHFPFIWLVFIFLKYIFSHFWHDRGDLGEVGHRAGQDDLTGNPLPILQIFYSSFDF